MWKAKTETNGWGTGRRSFDELENNSVLRNFGFEVGWWNKTEAENDALGIGTKRGCGGGEVKYAGNDGSRYNEKPCTGGWDASPVTGFGAAKRQVNKEVLRDFNG